MRRTLPLAFLLCVLSCATPGPRRVPPRVNVVLTSVEIVDLSFSDIALLATVRVDNPFPRAATLAGYAWAIELGDRGGVTGASEVAVTIAASSHVELAVPIALHFADVVARPGFAEQADALPYTLTLQFGADAPRLTHEGRLRLPSPPSVRVASLWVRRLSRREATVQLDLWMVPRSGAALELRALDCALWLEGRQVTRFALEHVAIPVDGDTRLPLSVHIPLGPSAQAVAALLRRAEARYRLRGHAVLQADGFGVLRLSIDDIGIVPLRPPAR